MITKEKFLAYLAVQEDGVTNMLDCETVSAHAKMAYGVELTVEACREIIIRYEELYKQYV